jgi:hypothetical protein
MGFSCGLSTEKAVQYKYAEKIMQRLIPNSLIIYSMQNRNKLLIKF